MRSNPTEFFHFIKRINAAAISYRLGFINFFFAISHQVAGVATGCALPAAIAFTIGAITMPTCCFLSAWKKPFRHLFFIPVGGVATGIILTLAGWPWGTN